MPTLRTCLVACIQRRTRCGRFAQRARTEDPQPAKGRELVPVRLWLHSESADGTVGFEISSDQLSAIAELGAVLSVELEIDDESSAS